MDTKQPLSLFLVAILAASAFSVIGITSLPLQKASAQDTTIETSADELGGTFYGESYLQVVIEDPDADDDDTVETISVTVDVDPDTGAAGTATFDVPETSDSSGRFEFFLVHEGSDIADTVLDSIADDAFVVSFGPTGAAGAIAEDEAITADVTLGAEDAEVSIDTGDDPVDVDYAQDAGVLALDRETPFGSDSLIHAFITDQDSNNDPTNADTFTVAATDMDGATFDDLFDLEGGTFPDAVTFTETGDNTAEFEAIFQLSEAASGDDDELVFTDDTLTLELHDHADYDDVPDADGDVVEDSTDTSEVTFEVDNEDGDVDSIADLTFGGELVATVRDGDQNRDSDTEDDIEDALVVVVGDGTGGQDSEFVDLTETGDNTGVFEIDLSNGELPVSFLDDVGVPVANNSILELRSEDIEEDISIEYIDALADDEADNGDSVVSFTVAMALTPGQLAAPEEVGVTDEFTVTLTDRDLNNNPRTRDSYTVELIDVSPFILTRGGLDYGEIYTVGIEVDGDPVDFGAVDVSVTLRETGINTGIFEMEIDVEDIADFGADGAELELSDGDDIEVSIDDFMADVGDADEDDVTITIGKPSVGLDFDKTSPPIPPEDDSAAVDADVDLGEDVIVRLILVDPTLGTQTNVEETFAVEFGDDAGTFTLEIDGDDVESIEVGDGDDLDDFDIVAGVGLEEVLEIGDLEETGENTGVFEAELTFNDAAGFDTGDLQDAEFTFTYTNDEGDEESAGFTFRGSDGVVTVDQPSAKAGTIVTITVEDQDLNLDSEEIDSFESTIGTDDPFIVAVEGEDDEIDGGETQTFEETGEDTGVFIAEFEVGEDIEIVDTAAGDQASNILITYNDEIDSTGGGGDELEVNVPVVSGTGSIQITPELVGPATTLTVLIIDSDLDEDAGSVDEFSEADLDGAVEFTSSRNEVDEGAPDIEETGPNTGVFMFTLELITDAEACRDDDLGDDDFEATGGDTDSTIGACPGDLISIRYEDEVTGSGAGSTVSEVVEVSSWDPEFVADQDSYGIGDRVTVSISDPDANRDPDIADSLTDLRVTSDSDRVGEEFSAIETGRDTGVFRLTFGTTQGTAGGSISVSQGDDVTIEYTDEFPADFVDEEEDKEFQFVVSVGGGDDIDSTTVTPPVPQDPTGQELDEVSAGQQVVLTTSVRNNNAAPQDFVALIEVRDSSGITVYLAWQTGTLPANGQTQVGLSWTPEFTDDYTVRTFVISDLNQPRVLSPVSESEIVVS